MALEELFDFALNRQQFATRNRAIAARNRPAKASIEALDEIDGAILLRTIEFLEHIAILDDFAARFQVLNDEWQKRRFTRCTRCKIHILERRHRLMRIELR